MLSQVAHGNSLQVMCHTAESIDRRMFDLFGNLGFEFVHAQPSYRNLARMPGTACRAPTGGGDTPVEWGMGGEIPPLEAVRNISVRN